MPVVRYGIFKTTEEESNQCLWLNLFACHSAGNGSQCLWWKALKHVYGAPDHFTYLKLNFMSIQTQPVTYRHLLYPFQYCP